MRALVLAAAFGLLATAALAQERTPAEAAADKALAECAPATRDAALVCLDTKWHPSARDRFLAGPYADLIQHHFGLGMWIRNNWIRRGGGLGGDLQKDGLRHIDDMSQRLIETYWLAKHGCEGPDVPKDIVEPIKDAGGCPAKSEESAL